MWTGRISPHHFCAPLGLKCSRSPGARGVCLQAPGPLCSLFWFTLRQQSAAAFSAAARHRFPLLQEDRFEKGLCLEPSVSSHLHSRVRQCPGGLQATEAVASQRALGGPWTEEPSCVSRRPPIGCAFCAGGVFGFKFLGEGGYFEGRGGGGGRVSEHANELFSTSHFQILKLLKGEGEISGLKSSMVGFLALLPPPATRAALASGRSRSPEMVF